MSCSRRYSICELLDMDSGCWDLSSRPQAQSRVCTVAVFLIVLFVCYTYLFCVWGVFMPRSVKWRSGELVLSFYHVDLRDLTQDVRLGNKCLYLLSHLSQPLDYF